MSVLHHVQTPFVLILDLNSGSSICSLHGKPLPSSHLLSPQLCLVPLLVYLKGIFKLACLNNTKSVFFAPKSLF